jgi:nitrate reductase gamma subunit
MRDYGLFAVAPYAAAALFIAGCLAQLMSARGEPRRSRPAAGGGVAAIAWRVALALIALAHLAALAAPDAVLLWTSHQTRLIALEVEGLIAAVVALTGVVGHLVRRGRDAAPLPVDAVAFTLLLVAMASGMGVAIFYRWASAWSEVTLVPYLYSVARLQPATDLVTRLPVLVKLHMGAAFMVIAVFPLTTLARTIVLTLLAGTRRMAAPVGRLHPVSRAAQRWASTRLQTALAVMFGNGEEEN